METKGTPAPRPVQCPACLMKYPDIHGVVYSGGRMIGQCDHSWHLELSAGCDTLDLTDADRDWLAKQNIGF